jgi:hypothetical protein
MKGGFSLNEKTKPEQKGRTLWKGVLLLLALLLPSMLAASLTPKPLRLVASSLSIAFSLIVTFIYIVSRSTLDPEDALRAYSGASMLVVIFVGFLYGVSQVEAGVEINVVPYMFGGIVPLSLVATFATYEVLDHKRSRGTLAFHLKRLAGRMVLVVVFVALFFALLNLLALVSQGADVSQVALVLSGIATALIALLMLRNPRGREVLRRLGDGNW